MKKISVDRSASKGIAIGKAYKYEKKILLPSDRESLGVEKEQTLFQEAVEKVLSDLEDLAISNEIFQGHMQLVKDPALKTSVEDKIKLEQNAELALKNTIDEFVMVFESMDDEYMKQRSDDIKDIYQRLIFAMQGEKFQDLSSLEEEVIVIAHDLAPSDTASMDFEKVRGFATEIGGITGHVSIMARNKNLPALVGVGEILDKVKDGDLIIIDGLDGNLIIEPDEITVKKYQDIKSEFSKKLEEINKNASKDAVTEDGKRALVYANVGNISDVEKAVKAHIDGIGLFRTEFLYMESDHFPTEEEQFKIYKKAVEICKKEVIIRTLDIGGDKDLSYYDFDKEENPFLGFRAIRLQLSMKKMFKDQLRALLRASAFGELSIMYPMIVSLEELFEANKVLEECKLELKEEGISFDENIKVGIMVETPAVVMEAESFAKHVDFFSIGTNDLTQYILAADRGNEKVAYLYDSYNPAVLHAIQRIIEAGHKEGIIVGMCGEFASDEKACKMLLGMGLDEFSVSSSSVSSIKNIIRNSNYENCKKISEELKNIHSRDEIEEKLKEYK
ncbi:MAG: phosphoenolpyruvate--protein phosphotransferase [Peptoniphilaceae bacterium]